MKFCLQFLDYQESMGRTACKDVNLFFLDYAQDEEEEEEEKSIEQQNKLMELQILLWFIKMSI